MFKRQPDIFNKIDGWVSHAYPNPDFSGRPDQTGENKVDSFLYDLKQLKKYTNKNLPIFITETGWDQDKLSNTLLTSYWQKAWQLWNSDPNVVAVTPFLLQGGDQFKSLSLLNKDGSYRASGQAIFDLPKSVGSPSLASPQSTPTPKPIIETNTHSPLFKASLALFKLENIFRVILGLPVKANISLKDISLTVELAQNASQWERGLSTRQTLGELDGMLFIFPRLHIPVFWMKDMHFPIDIIWIKDNLVVDITPSVQLEASNQLPTYSPHSPINMVLETRAGWAKENNLSIGDTLNIL